MDFLPGFSLWIRVFCFASCSFASCAATLELWKEAFLFFWCLLWHTGQTLICSDPKCLCSCCCWLSPHHTHQQQHQHPTDHPSRCGPLQQQHTCWPSASHTPATRSCSADASCTGATRRSTTSPTYVKLAVAPLTTQHQPAGGHCACLRHTINNCGRPPCWHLCSDATPGDRPSRRATAAAAPSCSACLCAVSTGRPRLTAPWGPSSSTLAMRLT